MTGLNWDQVNFNVWCVRTEKAEYTYQRLEPYDKVTHSAKLGSDVLIINNDAPIKVNDIEHAEMLISEHERTTPRKDR
jgi:hypothetical protein